MLAVVENARAVGEVARQQDVERPEVQREQQPPRERRHRHAAAAVVRRVHGRVALARRIVELALPARREHEVVRLLAVVDLRPRDRQRDARDGRQILDEQHRQPLGRHLVRRAERDAHAVRVGEVLVDEPLRRQRVGVQLARRQHHLAQLAADAIAVVVDRDEIVVRADRLDLPERLQQRLAIPEPHVVDRGAVGGDRRRRELGRRAELAQLHAGDPPRVARRLMCWAICGVSRDELVGLHDEPLIRRRARGSTSTTRIA